MTDWVPEIRFLRKFLLNNWKLKKILVQLTAFDTYFSSVQGSSTFQKFLDNQKDHCDQNFRENDFTEKISGTRSITNPESLNDEEQPLH